MTKRWRGSWPHELRDEARAEDKSLFLLSLVTPEGRTELMGPISHEGANRLLKAAMRENPNMQK